MKVDFYQLSAFPVEQVLPRIAERLVEERARLLVVADHSAVLDRLDRALWSYRDDGFLPHAIAGQDVDAEQPILLSAQMATDAANGARNIALADGQWRDDALTFERVFFLFDDQTVEGARTAWRALGDREDLERRFWRQDENGKWSRAA